MRFGFAFAMVAAAAAAGCAARHNIPATTEFPAMSENPPAAQVYLDANGSFYPSAWETRLPRERIEKEHALKAAARDEGTRRWISEQEEAQLRQLAALFAGKKRILFLIHGFNNDEHEADEAFDILQKRIVFAPGDAVVRVHWDGLVAESPVASGSIWFKAAGYSQVAGSVGLRKVLNLLERQQAVLLSHSRGASVILSALANPPYRSSFRRATERLSWNGAGYLSPRRLAERANRFDVILLGPAIGFPDFWDPSCEQLRAQGYCRYTVPCAPTATKGCTHYRAFSGQLRSLQYTINPGDTVLKKWVGNLSRSFNATNLGYKPAVGAELAKTYPFMKPPVILSEPHRHPFTLYAADPEVAAMLKAVGVEAH